MTTDFFHNEDFIRGNRLSDGALNRVLGAAACYVLDGENLTITRFNEQFYRVIGDEKMDQRIENIQNFVPAEDRPVLYRALREAQENVEEGGSCEVRFWKSDGSAFWFRMQFFLLGRDEAGLQFFGQVEDITESREQSISFFEVLREQADITMRLDLDRGVVQYVTEGHTLAQAGLPSMPLEESVGLTTSRRIESKEDREAFRAFFDVARLREAYRKAIYHEVLDIDFKLHEESEPVEFSTYYIGYSKNQSPSVFIFMRRRDRELLERDVLTGLGTRHSFSEHMRSIGKHPNLLENLIVFAMDVNGLKSINDTLGHQAGDEAIKGAASCISQVMACHGKCFRVSGDEFAAFLYGDDDLGEGLKGEVTRVLSEWRGELVDSVSVSCGYALASEHPGASIAELVKAADHEMYLAKARHYQRRGIDRRMQQAAYNALCDSYAKILKVNLTKDVFEVIRAEDSELDPAKGYNRHLSTWVANFAKADQVHPEDERAYLSELDLESLKRFFDEGNQRFCMRYRRRFGDEFRMVMLEMMPAPDYAADSQNVFLYVKVLDG